jgi:hypothetical protein
MYTTILTNAYYTTGAKHNGTSYSGMSSLDKQRCFVSNNGERISLVPMMDNVRMTKLTNLHISKRHTPN